MGVRGVPSSSFVRSLNSASLSTSAGAAASLSDPFVSSSFGTASVSSSAEAAASLVIPFGSAAAEEDDASLSSPASSSAFGDASSPPSSSFAGDAATLLSSSSPGWRSAAEEAASAFHRATSSSALAPPPVSCLLYPSSAASSPDSASSATERLCRAILHTSFWRPDNDHIESVLQTSSSTMDSSTEAARSQPFILPDRNSDAPSFARCTRESTFAKGAEDLMEDNHSKKCAVPPSASVGELMESSARCARPRLCMAAARTAAASSPSPMPAVSPTAALRCCIDWNTSCTEAS
mmetsp:Transcript_8772/g.18924  ORF Transcript_8772/g.18924 Transcript_8772/m.18924 type:complete len:293 (-) Transcript_8772:1212-2090(-)